MIGPAVQLSTSFGGTSGRFEVAEIAARVFPDAHDFVDRVEAEGLLDTPLVRHPYPGDILVRRGADQVRYTTPPHMLGLGTRSKLAPDALPIDGLEILYRNEMDLGSVAIRLPPALRPLAGVIIDAAARRGD